MGAGRMVLGLAAAAALAVIWKKHRESIWMWMLKNRKEEEKKMIRIQTKVKVSPETLNKKKESQQGFVERQQAHKQQVSGIKWSSEFVAEIPSDIWANILSRLPVKLVMRIRCMYKEWYSLTDDAAFRKLHCKRALQREPHTIFVPESVPTPGVLPLYELGPAYGQLTQYSPPVMLEHRYNYRISNPVNGLVVAYLEAGSYPYYYLLNPATREQSPLPASITLSGSLGCRVAFGFDASTGKYKLVRLFHKSSSQYRSCEILTIGSPEWRDIGDTPCGVNLLSQSVFLNGAIYWMALGHGLPSVGVLAFDIKGEKFQRISCSIPFSRDVHRGQFSLCQFGCQIFLVESPQFSYCPFLKIWTLKDDSGSHEWKQECNLDMSPHSDFIGRFPLQLIGFKDGKLMMKKSLLIYSYDLQSKAIEKIYPLRGFREVGPLYSMAESFISPRSLTDASG